MRESSVLIACGDSARLERLRSYLADNVDSLYLTGNADDVTAALDDKEFDLAIISTGPDGGEKMDNGLVRDLKNRMGNLLPVMLITPEDEDSMRLAGLEAGADDAVVESISRVELFLRIRRLLKLKRLQDSLSRANSRLELLSVTDPLTGLCNRRYIVERLQFEIARNKRYNSPLSCVMMDVDHFKKINDTYGHPYGDQVLKGLAEILKGTTRRVDLVGRYGGEEFVLLLPDTPNAMPLAERIRSTIEHENFDIEDGISIRITVSLGIATMTPNIENGEQLIQAADDALYQAKQDGRNKICQYTHKQ